MAYAKTIAAAVGVLALLAKQFLGVEIGGDQVNKIADGLVALATVLAVYQTPNKQ